jgi:hypothetical protein
MRRLMRFHEFTRVMDGPSTLGVGEENPINSSNLIKAVLPTAAWSSAACPKEFGDNA